MIRRIAPQFFTTAMAATLAYYVVKNCDGRLLAFGANLR